MGLLDSLTSALSNQPAQAGAANPTSAVLSEMLTLIENRPGGLAGLMQSFQQNGLGHLFQSWVGTGQNLPVSASQIQSTLGAEATAKIAQVTGIPQAEVESHLASLLPQLIDHMTPNGQLPQGGPGGETGELRGMLAGFAQRFLHN
jgi:uncharacterized protein YidB (DUF937 family)